MYWMSKAASKHDPCCGVSYAQEPRHQALKSRLTLGGQLIHTRVDLLILLVQAAAQDFTERPVSY